MTNAMMDEGSKVAMLWTDERIGIMINDERMYLLSEPVRHAWVLLKIIRDFYEHERKKNLATIAKQAARIEQLERELNALAGWEPVEDGEVSSFVYVDNGGKLLGVFAGDDYTDWYATEDLPDDLRLCRRTGTGTQQGGSE